MAAQNEVRPIIIKKKKIISGGGHHGGAWKVAMFVLPHLVRRMDSAPVSDLPSQISPKRRSDACVGLLRPDTPPSTVQGNHCPKALTSC